MLDKEENMIAGLHRIDGGMRLTAIFLSERVKSDVKEWSEKESLYPFKFGMPYDGVARMAMYPKGKYLVDGMTPLRFGWVRTKDINVTKFKNWGRVRRDPQNIEIVQKCIENGEYEPYANIPPVIDEEGNLIAGFHRWEGHRLEKQEYIWCLICGFESEDVKEEYNSHENTMCEHFSKIIPSPESFAQLIWRSMTTVDNKTGKWKTNHSKNGAIKWLRERGIKKQQSTIANLAMDLLNSGKGIVPMHSFTEGEMKKIYGDYFGEPYKAKTGVTQYDSKGTIVTVNVTGEFWEQRRLIRAMYSFLNGSSKNIIIQFTHLNSSVDLEKFKKRYLIEFCAWLKDWGKIYSEGDQIQITNTSVNP